MPNSIADHFDPLRISYGRVLQIYSRSRRPDENQSQGPDTARIRSAIFVENPRAGTAIAAAYIAQLNQEESVFPSAIVTTIEPGKQFYPAEAYHQDYLTLHPTCSISRSTICPRSGRWSSLFPRSLTVPTQCWSRRRNRRSEVGGDGTACRSAPVAGYRP